jgi:hypothetical protein
MDAFLEWVIAITSIGVLWIALDIVASVIWMRIRNIE